jgi:hypothetical protein
MSALLVLDAQKSMTNDKIKNEILPNLVSFLRIWMKTNNPVLFTRTVYSLQDSTQDDDFAQEIKPVMTKSTECYSFTKYQVSFAK